MTETTASDVYSKLATLSDSWQQQVDNLRLWQAGPSKDADTNPPDGDDANKGFRVLTDPAGNAVLVMTPAEMERFVTENAAKIDDVSKWHSDVQLWHPQISAQYTAIGDWYSEIDGWNTAISAWHAQVDSWQQQVSLDKDTAAQSATSATTSANTAADAALTATSEADRAQQEADRAQQIVNGDIYWSSIQDREIIENQISSIETLAYAGLIR